MRWALLLALVGGCPEHGSTPGGPIGDATDPELCLAALNASLDRTCTVPGDCALIDHGDCCGIVKLGVRIGSEGSANAAEAEFQKCRACPPLGCAHPDLAEDGNIPAMGQAIVATCVSSRCTSVVQ
jgi:hypothetical protein